MSESLSLQCLYFDRSPTGGELFYFSELTTLEVSMLVSDSSELSTCYLFAETGNSVLDESVWARFKVLGDFNRFFVNHPEYHLHDVKLSFSDGSELSSHDDGEVSIRIGLKCVTESIVFRILRMKGLPVTLEQELRSSPGKYLSLDSEGRVLGRFDSFDAYLRASD